MSNLYYLKSYQAQEKLEHWSLPSKKLLKLPISMCWCAPHRILHVTKLPNVFSMSSKTKNDMYRMFARSVLPDRVCPRLKSVSNLRNGKHFNPALKILYRYRVIITTLCTSSCFARAHIDKKVYDPKHFSYVFIDECSSASEVLTLVPIAGNCFTLFEANKAENFMHFPCI